MAMYCRAPYLLCSSVSLCWAVAGCQGWGWAASASGVTALTSLTTTAREVSLSGALMSAEQVWHLPLHGVIDYNKHMCQECGPPKAQQDHENVYGH